MRYTKFSFAFVLVGLYCTCLLFFGGCAPAPSGSFGIDAIDEQAVCPYCDDHATHGGATHGGAGTVTPNTVTQDAGTQDSGETVNAASELRSRVPVSDMSNPVSIVSVPVRALSSQRDRMVLQQVEHALNLFRAEHNRLPADITEFMDSIVRPNNISLPQLQPGEEYIFDGELQIRKP